MANNQIELLLLTYLFPRSDKGGASHDGKHADKKD